MLMSEIFQESCGALWQNKSRTFLAVLGIVIGIASVIVLTGIGNGSQSEITSNISSLGTNLVTVSPKGEGVLKQSDLDLILDNDFNQLLANHSPEVSRYLNLVANEKNENLNIIGAGANYLQVHDQQIQLGSYFSPEMLTENQKVVILGQTTAETFFGSAAASLGQKIKIGHSSFYIIGVLKSIGGSNLNDRDNLALIPTTVMQDQFLSDRNYNSLAFLLHDSTDLEAAKSLIGYSLLSSHNLTKVSEADFHIFSPTDLLETMTSVQKTFTFMLSGIASISLLVGGIGIMNVMLMSVLERTREIGLRKALGAKKKILILQFLFEAILITVIGGFLGLLLGLGFSFILNQFFDVAIKISSESIILSLLVSSLIGLLFGIYPANRAACLQPIEALRHD